MWRRFSLALAAAVTGCATSPTLRPGTGDQIQVKVQTLPATDAAAGIRLLAPGGIVHSGDRLALRVEAGRRSYLYLLHQVEAGDPEVIVPVGDAPPPPAEPERPAFLPSQGQWFTVDQALGTESYYLVASTQTLDRSRLQEVVRRSATVERGDPSQDADEKGRDPDPIQRAPIGSDGMAVVRLWFRHQ